MKKRNIIIGIFILVIIVVLGKVLIDRYNISNDDIGTTREDNTPRNTTTDFQTYLDNIASGGPPKDGIPPIDDPQYLSIAEAEDYLEEKDKVFVYEALEGTYLYPQRILVWHEIVNDKFDGENISITYCPLTGSTVAFLGKVSTYENNTYGTSGKLLNSNLVMYDRDTDSYIPQILGMGINSSLAGIALDTHPIHWSNWEDAKKAFPEAKVLSTKTQFLRDYYSDPYGTYDDGDDQSYYFSEGTLFSLMNKNDGTFRDKKIVVGVKLLDDALALDPFFIRSENVFNFKIASTNAVAFYDTSLKTVRVFFSTLDNETFVFDYKNQKIVDESGTIWSENGVSSDGKSLQPMYYFDVMWFAWNAFYPDTKVIK